MQSEEQPFRTAASDAEGSASTGESSHSSQLGLDMPSDPDDVDVDMDVAENQQN